MTTLSTLNSRGRDAPRLPKCSTAHIPKMQQRTACLNRQKPVFYRLVAVFFVIHHTIAGHLFTSSHTRINFFTHHEWLCNRHTEGGGNYFR